MSNRISKRIKGLTITLEHKQIWLEPEGGGISLVPSISPWGEKTWGVYAVHCRAFWDGLAAGTTIPEKQLIQAMGELLRAG